MTKREKYLQAREMRQQGMSLLHIAAALGVAKSSVSLWVRDIQLSEAQQTALSQSRGAPGRAKWAVQNRQQHQDQRLAYQQRGREQARQDDRLHVMGCMLYWAEGAKKRNSVYFVNSDADMLCLFMRFLRECYQVQDQEFTVYITTHEHESERMAAVEAYWLQLLNLPATCLRKTQTKKGSAERINKMSNGVCGLRVNRTDLVQQIYGAIQEYAGFDRPEWVDLR